jgi:hypothetical protein
MAMNSAVCNHQETGSDTHSCHAEADIVHQVADVLVTNSAVFFLFPPKQRWQELRKTGKMRLRKTKKQGRNRHGDASKLPSLNHQHIFQSKNQWN